ncbi:hypothetical protein V8C86DRAFT_2587888 [Haematococcus lacustris]
MHGVLVVRQAAVHWPQVVCVRVDNVFVSQQRVDSSLSDCPLLDPLGGACVLKHQGLDGNSHGAPLALVHYAKVALADDSFECDLLHVYAKGILAVLNDVAQLSRRRLQGLVAGNAPLQHVAGSIMRAWLGSAASVILAHHHWACGRLVSRHWKRDSIGKHPGFGILRRRAARLGGDVGLTVLQVLGPALPMRRFVLLAPLRFPSVRCSAAARRLLKRLASSLRIWFTQL